MKDFNVTFKVRNNKLLSLMRMFGYETAADLSRASGVAQVNIGLYLNLKKAPLSPNNKFRPSVVKLAAFFKVLEEDLFPKDFLDKALQKNQVEREYSANEVEYFLEDKGDYNPEVLLEDEEKAERCKEAINSIILLALTPKQQRHALDKIRDYALLVEQGSDYYYMHDVVKRVLELAREGLGDE